MNTVTKGNSQSGFSLVEMLVSLIIGGLVIAGLNGTINNALGNRAHEQVRIAAARDADFALQRMAHNLSRTNRLMVPRKDDPGTAYSEALRNPGVLAFTLDPELDRDRDGVADADNDGDGLVDEDPSGDLTNDLATGIIGIDDDNDGAVDEAHSSSGPAEDDDDEDDTANEDSWDGTDNDGDGTADEDTKKDVSHDGQAGLIGVDDDGDTLVDEGDKNDDDEDGLVNEDWLDTVAYFLNGTQLIERMPDLNPTDGTDYTERVLADDVALFEVELEAAQARGQRIRLELHITAADGELIKMTTSVRVGGAL